MAGSKRCGYCGRTYSARAMWCDCKRQSVFAMLAPEPPSISPARPETLTIGRAVRFVIPGGSKWHTGIIIREQYNTINLYTRLPEVCVHIRINVGENQTFIGATMAVPITNVELVESDHETA